MRLTLEVCTVDETTFIVIPTFYVSWSPRSELGVVWGMWAFTATVSNQEALR